VSWSADGGDQDAGYAPEDCLTNARFHRKEWAMFYYAPVFLVVGVVAGALNFSGMSNSVPA
jgi:hypothetical protein